MRRTRVSLLLALLQLAGSSGEVGLRGIRERLRQLAGSLSVQSGPLQRSVRNCRPSDDTCLESPMRVISLPFATPLRSPPFSGVSWLDSNINQFS